MLAVPSTVRAQDDFPVHLTISGGVTAPMQSTGDRFGLGGGIALGLVVDVNERVAVEGEWMFANLPGQTRSVPASSSPIITTPGLDTGSIEFTSRHAMQYASFNVILNLKPAASMMPYLIGGAGMYYRSFALTTPGVGFVAMCDPYWLVCYPTLEPVDRVAGHRISWDPGASVGGGIGMKVGQSSEVFVEARWHFMSGPQIADAAGATRRVTGQYVPLTLGVRF